MVDRWEDQTATEDTTANYARIPKPVSIRVENGVGWFSRALAFRPLYYPWGKMGTTRSPFPTPQYVLHLFRHRLHMDEKQSIYRLKSLKERHFLCPVNVWGGNAKKNSVIYTKVNINFVYCTINATLRWRNGLENPTSHQSKIRNSFHILRRAKSENLQI